MAHPTDSSPHPSLRPRTITKSVDFPYPTDLTAPLLTAASPSRSLRSGLISQVLPLQKRAQDKGARKNGAPPPLETESEAEDQLENERREAEDAEQDGRYARCTLAIDETEEMVRRALLGVPREALFRDDWEEEERSIAVASIANALEGLVEAIKLASEDENIEIESILSALEVVDNEVEEVNGAKGDGEERIELRDIMEAALCSVRDVAVESGLSEYLSGVASEHFEGRFSAGVRWERIFEGLLFERLDPSSADLEQPLPERLRQTYSSFHPPTLRSPSLLATFPAEILRTIFHFGAQSLLPPATASVHDRRIFHGQWSQYLRNAALVCRAWRHETQTELVSVAYCTNRRNLDRFITFITKTKRTKLVRGIVIDIPEEEEKGLWLSVARLGEVCPKLPVVEIGGELTVNGMCVHLKARSTSLRLSNCPLPLHFFLPPSVTDFALVNGLGIDIFHFGVSSVDTSNLRHLSLLGGTLSEFDSDEPPTHSPFPNVTSLLLDTNPLALELVNSPLPSVKLVDLVTNLVDESVFVGTVFETDEFVDREACSKLVLEAILLLPALEELRLPREQGWTEDGHKGIEEKCAKKGIRVVWKEGGREDWI